MKINYFEFLKHLIRFRRVSNQSCGLDGWRKRRSDLYEKYAGQNATVFAPDKVH